MDNYPTKGVPVIWHSKKGYVNFLKLKRNLLRLSCGATYSKNFILLNYHHVFHDVLCHSLIKQSDLANGTPAVK